MAVAASSDTVSQVKPLVTIALDRLATSQSGAQSTSYVALIELIPPGVRASVDRELREVKVELNPS
jgi:hypothetical protein